MPYKDPQKDKECHARLRARNREKYRENGRKNVRLWRSKMSLEERRALWRLEYRKRAARDREGLNKRRMEYYYRNRRYIIMRVLKRKVDAGPFDENGWWMRFEFYGRKCAYCGVELTMDNATIDHVIPIVDGGRNWSSNLVPACGVCNSTKHRFHWKPRNFANRLFIEYV